ncbi:hypothetical protein [uncultured Thalassospira sp.]|uniref:MMPL family transporter n=1 Tax=uncultured Thalassospira sp. TaxID=404382 RepID=UPI00258C1AB8|nr:hypothetical protein [uncultured Thalassospira sp.]
MNVRAVIWGLCLIVMGVLTFWQINTQNAKIDGDILSLIGREHHDGDADQQDRLSDITIVRDLLRRDANQVIIMMSHPDRDQLEKASRTLAQHFRDMDGTASVSLPGLETGDARSLYGFYLDHAGGLLSQKDRDLLTNGDGQRIYKRAVQSLYAPSSIVSAQSLASDPFSLLPGFLAELGDKIGQSGLVQKDDRYGTPIIITLAPHVRTSGFEADWVKHANDLIATATASDDNLLIAKTGQIFFAVSEATHAKSDVQRIAMIVTFGVIAMVVWVFMSPLPILAALLTVGSGLLAGITALVLIFDSIHAIALVFGASLIGISIDYALHYLVLPGSSGTDDTRLSHVRPGLRLGLLTTVCGFSALAFTPTILLAQISVYSIAGLIAAYVTVVTILPCLPARNIRDRAAIRVIYQKIDTVLLAVRPSNGLRHVMLVLATVALIGAAFYLPANDDIAALGHGDDALIADARMIGETLGMGGNPQFIRVDGDDIQDRLETGEAVRDALRPLITDGRIGSLFGLSDVIPSISRQNANRALITSQLIEPFGPQLQAVIPVDISSTQDAKTPLEPAPEILAAIPGLSGLQRGKTDIIRLNAVKDVDAVRDAISHIGQARLINPRQTITGQFARYRVWASIALGVSLLVAGLVAVLRYGFPDGLHVVAAPLIAILCAVCGAFVLGVTINFFAIMALFLVFAIGADYAIFTSESRQHGTQDATRFAVFLSLISSVLAFGLLATSSVPVVNAIGTIISIGLISAWVLSYWMCTGHKGNDHRTTHPQSRGHQ